MFGFGFLAFVSASTIFPTIGALKWLIYMGVSGYTMLSGGVRLRKEQLIMKAAICVVGIVFVEFMFAIINGGFQ